ncbi:MAG: tail fiber domain-containing protein, partial [Candidatus Poseidoniales archaeon]
FWDASAESLGLGTSSPGSELHVKGADETQVYIEAPAGSNAGIRLLENGTSKWTIGNDQSNDGLFFYDFTATAERLRIDASGNVGIGTQSPVSPLTTSIGAGSAGSLNNQIAMTHSGASNSYHIKTIRAAADDEPAGLAFVENTTERMRIDSSGNVGIGTTPASGVRLDIRSNAAATLGDFRNASSTGFGLYVAAGDTDSQYAFRAADYQNNALVTITGAGNLLVAKTGLDTAVAGTEIRPNLVAITSAGDAPLYLRRNTNDGELINFKQGTDVVGAIGTDTSNSDLYIGNGDTAIMFHNGVDAIFPHNASTNASRDAAIDIGYSSYRFKDLYLSGTASMTGLEPGVVTIGSSSYFIGNATNGYRFNNAADTSNLMILKDSGDLLVGTTSSVGSSTAKLEILGATSGGRCINTKVTIDTSANHITFHNGNGQVGSVSTNGTATAYNTSSDQRLKENIVDAPSASDDIDAIQVRSFDWKVDGSH